jgi:hypothetical protein
VKQYEPDEVASIIGALQLRVVDNTVEAMAWQIEAVCAAFSPDGNMDIEAQAAAFAMLGKLVAEIMRRALGLNNKDGRYERWLAQHVISVKRQLAAMADEREVEVATIEKHLRSVLGAREQ